MSTNIEHFALISPDQKTRFTVIKNNDNDTLMSGLEKFNQYLNVWQYVSGPSIKDRTIIEKQWKEAIRDGFTRIVIDSSIHQSVSQKKEPIVKPTKKTIINESLIHEHIKNQIESLKKQASEIYSLANYADDYSVYCEETRYADALMWKATSMLNQYGLIEV